MNIIVHNVNNIVVVLRMNLFILVIFCHLFFASIECQRDVNCAIGII